MNRKNVIVLSVISILTLLVMAFGATYAFLATMVDEEKSTSLTAETNAKIPTFIALSDNSLSIDISYDEMFEINASDTNTSSNLTSSTITNFMLLSGADNKISNCKFDVVFEWDSDSNEYIKTENTTKEFTITGELLNYENIEEVDDTYSMVEYTNDINNLPETNLDALSWNEKDGKNYATLITGAHISSNSMVTPTKINYLFTLKFYNTTKNQNELLNKTFKGSIKVYTDTLYCEVQ